MRVELIIQKSLKKMFLIQFIIFISIPLIIYTEENQNSNINNNNYNNCDTKKYLKRKCNISLESDEEKYLFKTEVINMIIHGNLSDVIQDIIDNGNDIIIREKTEIYEIMNIDRQIYYNNITQLDFSKCINYIILKYLLFSQDFLVFKIEHFLTSYRIPIIEYYLFTQNGIYIQCDNETVDYYIPVKGIDNDALYLYNRSSDYYNDECSQYKSLNNTDLTLYTRKNDFNIKYLSVCETNCTFQGYDPITSKVECECKARNKVFSQSELKRNDLIYFFDNEEQISNFYVLNCYFLVSSTDDIKTNPGFYLTVIILSFFVLIYIFFVFKGYSSLKRRIDEAIKLKFHPSKEDEKNNKLIIVRINNNKNNKNNDNQRNDNKIKKSKKKNSKTNRASKNDIKKLNKNKSHSKSLSLGSRNNIMQIKNEENERKNHKTNESEKIDETKDEDIFIFENDYEINSLPFEQALRYDKRTCYELYTSLIRNKQLFLFSFLDYNSYNSSILKKTIFFLSFIYHYGFNAFFFTDDTMQKVYEDEGKFNPQTLVPNAIYSSLCCYVLIRVLTDFLVLSEKQILNIKNQKTEDIANEEKNKFLKIMCIKFIIFFVINLSLLIFFWFYLTCFNALYLNTRKFLIINTIISFILSNIFPLIFNIIPAFFRIDVLKSQNQKNSKKKNKAQPKTESELKDAEYVYNVSQFLQKI